MKTIFYSDGLTTVSLGDWVQTRIFFRKRQGRVVYVPGISKTNPTMDFNGLVYVGYQIVNGPFVGTVVDPEKFCLQKKVRFLRRDASPVAELKPNDDPFDESQL